MDLSAHARRFGENPPNRVQFVVHCIFPRKGPSRCRLSDTPSKCVEATCGETFEQVALLGAFRDTPRPMKERARADAAAPLDTPPAWIQPAGTGARETHSLCWRGLEGAMGVSTSKFLEFLFPASLH